MEMGMRSLTNFNDCLRYSLGPPEKVLLIRFNDPILMVFNIESMGVMILERNIKVNWYDRV
jgi:hypothetical protein